MPLHTPVVVVVVVVAVVVVVVVVHPSWNVGPCDATFSFESLLKEQGMGLVL